ncbi:DoxX family membrane protein, partial [Gammaproteobacteria bacterium]|nr:DoxX family membrane protein [Gammaproteobacteria bacterium]
MIEFYRSLTRALGSLDTLLPTLARLVFAGVLLAYFWGSAMTKVGDGMFGLLVLDDGAYAQIFPKVFEAASYDSQALGIGYKIIAVLGTWAEFLLPAMIVMGFATRLAAIGMAGFVIVQSYVDLYGHGGIEHKATVGTWFDRASGALIA